MNLSKETAAMLGLLGSVALATYLWLNSPPQPAFVAVAEANGQQVLLSDKPYNCPKNQQYVEYRGKGVSVSGCALITPQGVLIQWMDGDVGLVPLDLFKPTP